MAINSDDIIAAVAKSPDASRTLYVPAKYCEMCKQAKADDEIEFEPGSDTCRVCQDRKDELASLPVQRKALTRLLNSIEKGHTVPNSTDLLGSFYRHLGGVEGVARKLAETYDSARVDEDHKVCARILDIVVRLQTKVSEGQRQVAMETMSNEELRAYLLQLHTDYIEAVARDPLALPAPPPEEVPHE